MPILGLYLWEIWRFGSWVNFQRAMAVFICDMWWFVWDSYKNWKYTFYLVTRYTWYVFDSMSIHTILNFSHNITKQLDEFFFQRKRMQLNKLWVYSCLSKTSWELRNTQPKCFPQTRNHRSKGKLFLLDIRSHKMQPRSWVMLCYNPTYIYIYWNSNCGKFG